MPDASDDDWELPASLRPDPGEVGYDLDEVLTGVVGLRSEIPDDAFTATVLGTERQGNGVLLDNGYVLTIGYLITEAETIWLTTAEGGAVPGHVVGFDPESGLGLVQALGRMTMHGFTLGDSSAARTGDKVVVAGAGGIRRALSARIRAKREFAGYWEYVLDEAIFTTPPYPNWSGAAVIGDGGALIGIGSLHIQQSSDDGDSIDLNMIVPINSVKPNLDDLMRLGRPDRQPRPWLGMYTVERDDQLVVAGLARNGPAHKADIRPGDVVHAIDGDPVPDLATLFRRVWSHGDAGVGIPLQVQRDGEIIAVTVQSADRNTFLKSPRMH